MSDLHRWMQACSHEGETMLASVESTHLQWIVQMRSSEQSMRNSPSLAQNNSKRTTVNSATSTRAEGFRSMARDCKDIGSEEHVWQKISICSTDQRTNELENRFGIFGDEEIMLAVKKLMLQSLTNFSSHWRTSWRL